MIEVSIYDGIEWRLMGTYKSWLAAAAAAERWHSNGSRVRIIGEPL